MENGQEVQAPRPGLRVVTGELHRIRQGKTHSFVARPRAKVPVQRRPARAAVMLALAHQIQRAIDAGVTKDRVEAAATLGISGARATQLLDLTLLAPVIQEAVLAMESVDGTEPVSERTLRDVCRYDRWDLQQAAWNAPRKEG